MSSFAAFEEELRAQVSQFLGHLQLCPKIPAFILLRENEQRACDRCREVVDRYLTCTGCELATYCSERCQRKHFRTHKPFCSQGKQAQVFENLPVKEMGNSLVEKTIGYLVSFLASCPPPGGNVLQLCQALVDATFNGDLHSFRATRLFFVAVVLQARFRFLLKKNFDGQNTATVLRSRLGDPSGRSLPLCIVGDVLGLLPAHLRSRRFDLAVPLLVQLKRLAASNEWAGWIYSHFEFMYTVAKEEEPTPELLTRALELAKRPGPGQALVCVNLMRLYALCTLRYRLHPLPFPDSDIVDALEVLPKERVFCFRFLVLWRESSALLFYQHVRFASGTPSGKRRILGVALDMSRGLFNLVKKLGSPRQRKTAYVLRAAVLLLAAENQQDPDEADKYREQSRQIRERASRYTSCSSDQALLEAVSKVKLVFDWFPDDLGKDALKLADLLRTLYGSRLASEEKKN